jgi:hypothetical protein
MLMRNERKRMRAPDGNNAHPLQQFGNSSVSKPSRADFD